MKIAAALLVLACLSARADEDAPKRAVPDYDGRGPEDASLARDLLVVPRVVLAPLYLVSDFVLRRPILFGLAKLEEAHVLSEAATYRSHKGSIMPVLTWDRGLAPQVGVYVDEPALHLRGEGRIWFDHTQLTLLPRVDVDDVRLLARVEYEGSSDSEFYGLGPASAQDAQARYQLRRGEAAVGASWWSHKRERLTAEIGWRAVDFGDDACCDDPSVAERAAMGAFPRPAGLDGYEGPFGGVRLVLDSRRKPTDAGGGLTLAEALGSDLKGGALWLTSGARLGGSLDLTGHHRVVSLTLDARLASLVAGDAVPFTELPSLGGAEPLPGFTPRRLVDRSALALTAGYEWPIWGYAIGQLEVACGDVFGADFDGVDPDLFRLSFGMGLATRGGGAERGVRDYGFRLFVGAGSAPFGAGFSVDFVRVTLGMGL